MEAFTRMPEVFRQADPLAGIDLFADILCRFWETNRRLIRRMRGIANAEPELEEVVRGHDTRRLVALRGFVERYGLASGAEAEQLVRALFAMTGFEFFEALGQDNSAPENVPSEMKQLLRQCLRSF